MVVPIADVLYKATTLDGLILHAGLKCCNTRGNNKMGGGLDETPQAYKDIEEVMRSQRQLVDTVGVFTPKIVRMDG